MSDNTTASNLDWTNIGITAGIAFGAAVLSCVGHAAITAYALKSNNPQPAPQPQPAQPQPQAAPAQPAPEATAQPTPPPADAAAA